MDRVRSVAPFTRVMTFTGPLNVLDAHSSLNKMFGLAPTMIQIIKHTKRQRTTEETDYLTSKMLAFCNLCLLQFFVILFN